MGCCLAWLLANPALPIKAKISGVKYMIRYDVRHWVAGAAVACMALGTVPFAAPAMAQEWIWRDGACPSGYSQGQPGRAGQSDSDKCYKGSFGVYTPPTYGSIKKASAFDRCPVGYHTSEPDVMECVSYDYAAGKQPLTRAKNGKPCAAEEVDEWGLWCTSKVTQLTRVEAEQEAVADVNHLFPRDGKGGNQGAEHYNTPGIVAIFGPRGGRSSSTAGNNSGDSQTAQNSGCANGSATGAAIGGAMAGEGGAVLGSMLGGLGKKKKKGGC